MQISYKRVALVLGFVALTIGIGVAIYFVFFRNVFAPRNENFNVNGVVFPGVNENRNLNVNAANVNALPNINALVGKPQPVAQGGLTSVVPIVSTLPGGAILANNGRDLLYYDSETGQFYQISPDGRTKTLLTPDAYPGVEKITWSPLRDKAVLEFPDDSKFLYDFRHKRQYTLAPEMEDITFSPTADQIAFKFIGDDPDDRFLVVSNFDGTNSRSTEPLGGKENQFTPNWSPSGNVIGTFQESIDAERQRVIPLGQLGENFASFNVPGRGFQGTWSPDGEKILFSVFSKESAFNPTLYVSDGRTENIGERTLNLGVQTWPNKCAFGSSTSLYCAVPQFLEQGTGLFPDLAKKVPDDFYRIDLATGQKQLLARPVDQNGNDVFSANQVFLSADESLLYFFDERTRQIQKIQLK